MSFRLYDAKQNRNYFLQEGDKRSIGRSPENDVRVCTGLTAQYISRNHAQIKIQSGKPQLKDLASRNGTFVKSKGSVSWKQIKEEWEEIPPNATLSLGDPEGSCLIHTLELICTQSS